MANVVARGKDLTTGKYRVLDPADVLTDTAGTQLSGVSGSNITGYTICFGADVIAASNFLTAESPSTAADTDASSHTTIATAPVAGTLKAASLKVETPTPTVTWEIQINQVTQFEQEVTDNDNIYNMNISISAGDEIEIFMNGLNNETNAVLYIETSGGGYVDNFGVSSFSTGTFAKTGRSAGNGAVSSATTWTTRSPITIAGNLDAVSWSQANDSNATMKLWLNGVEDDTFTASGLTGVDASVNIAVAAGDYVELEYDAGATSPGASTWWYHVTPSSQDDGKGFSLDFAGDIAATSHALFANNGADFNTSVSIVDPENTLLCPISGTVYAISVYRQTASATQYQILIAESRIAILDTSTDNPAFTTGLSVTVKAGDTIRVKKDVDDGDSSVKVYIK